MILPAVLAGIGGYLLGQALRWLHYRRKVRRLVAAFPGARLARLRFNPFTGIAHIRVAMPGPAGEDWCTYYGQLGAAEQSLARMLDGWA